MLKNTQTILNSSSTITLDQTQLRNFTEAKNAVTELGKIEAVRRMEVANIIDISSLPSDEDLIRLAEATSVPKS